MLLTQDLQNHVLERETAVEKHEIARLRGLVSCQEEQRWVASIAIHQAQGQLKELEAQGRIPVEETRWLQESGTKIAEIQQRHVAEAVALQPGNPTYAAPAEANAFGGASDEQAVAADSSGSADKRDDADMQEDLCLPQTLTLM